MILEGFKFSISFLKDNFSKLFLIVSLPFVLELLITSISVDYMTDESSAEFVSVPLILFIIPGIYIALRYSFYAFEILLSQKKGSESMKDTFAMTKSKTVQIFFYFLAPMVITILLTVMIFSFVEVMIISILYTYLLIVFFTIYTYYLYDRLKGDTNGIESK